LLSNGNNSDYYEILADMKKLYYSLAGQLDAGRAFRVIHEIPTILQ
jgi:hypothetical protein